MNALAALDEALRRLSPEQRAVVDTWGQGQAVLAGAGSGKTTTLVIKCAELLRRKPEARFAAVSFTERSASDLRLKLSERLPPPVAGGSGGALGGHWVMTIHGLCGTILREFPREAGFDGEETMLAETEAQLLWERATDSLWFGDLPEGLGPELDILLERESRDSLLGLLKRVRELAAFGALESLTGSPENPEHDPAARALAKVGRFVLDRYDRLKRRRGALDFNDLERGADRALEFPHVRDAFHRRFDLVLVDEFQDTNPLQARIVLRFCKPDASNLCVVGDPKQSIYRFRDADVSVFEDFCARLPVRQVLSWNFRSRPGIIHFTNALCARAFADSEMRYDALEPKREAHESLEPVARLDVTSPAELATWIRAEVDRGIPLHEMALLVRRVRGNEKWFKALTAAGIPIALGSGGLYWEDPRVRELVAFLRWWDLPENALSGVTFLRAPWVAVADAEIDAWVRVDPTLQKAFLASEHPLARALRPLQGRPLRPAELLLALLISDEVEQEIGAPLLALWHRVEELSNRGQDFHAVVQELSRAVEESRREREVPPPRNQGQLAVLTLHSSKGLEFPHVILVDLGEKPRSMGAPLLFWDRERGACLAPRDEDGERNSRHPVEVEWRARERSKELAESKRVFYVALTRARERLVLVCLALSERSLEKGFDPETVFTEDYWRGWTECFSADLPRLSPPLSASSPDEASAQAPASGRGPGTGLPRDVREGRRFQRPRHSVTEWNLLSRCPRAYEWTYIRPRVAPMQEETTAESSAEIGSAVHAALETGDLEALHALERQVGSARFRAEPVVEWARQSEWMRPGEAVYAELAFEAPIAGEVLVGSIDRLRVEPDSLAVIDFKVTSGRRSAADLGEAYRTQLALYAFAARKMGRVGAEAPVRTVLVQISPEGVKEVEVDTSRGLDPESLASLAARIVDGLAGEPRPGGHCRYCAFQTSCQA